MSDQKELIPMQPGDVLRCGRERKGLTVESAARDAHIRPAVIAAIESGETDHIPCVYLKGYMRNYARFLGVELAGLNEQIETVKGAEPELRPVFSAGPPRGRTEKWLKASSYLAASFLIAALAWQFTHEAVRLSQGETRINGAARSEPAGQAAGEAVRVQERTHLNASIAAVEMLDSEAEPQPGAAAEEAWAALHNPPLPADGHLLSLKASADTWVEIFGAGDEQLEMDLVRAGTSREYSGPGPFRVMVGRASAVEMMLDGEAVDLGPHTRGNVASLVLAAAVEPGGEETPGPENH